MDPQNELTANDFEMKVSSNQRDSTYR